MPFEAWHLIWLKLQAAQAGQGLSLTYPYGMSLKEAGPCYSAFVGATVIACAGVMSLWPGRALAWSLMSEQMPRYRIAVYKGITRFLNGYRVRRLECTIDPRHQDAQRFAHRLGFRFESLMPKYTPLGDDQELWVRIE